jgi:DNA-binding Xre family transcriptional regulator
VYRRRFLTMPNRELTDHWVDKLCVDHGMSINEISRRTGLSTGFFSNCKRRGTPIDGVVARNLLKLSEALGVEMSDMLDRYSE